jgi:hypothetical protein
MAVMCLDDKAISGKVEDEQTRENNEVKEF